MENKNSFDFPSTPNTILGEIMRHRDDSIWNVSWSSFFTIYNGIVRIMAQNTMRRTGFSRYSKDDIDEIVCEVFVNLQRVFTQNKYVPENHRFRGFLKSVVYGRTIDYIRKKYPKCAINVEAIDIVEALQKKKSGDLFAVDKSFEFFEENEERAYRLAQLYQIWEGIKDSYDQNNAIIFESVYLRGKSVRQACEEFGISRNAVDKALARIMKRIKKEFEKMNGAKE
ncbi:MAG: sigma-70 family RNA polymerase sigma factor [Opitutales bacterium]|nr:sigma-70 family RNA polymerase sigma factor [Opitutales bacterium]